MVLSASRRTDIPRFYTDWLLARLRAGCVVTKNPMNPSQVSRLRFSPDSVDCLVFWSKDPEPLLERLAEIDRMGYRYYFQFTLTPYGSAIEKNLRPKAEIVETFRALSEQIGREKVVWRYDPILLADGIDVAWHRRRFADLCETLAPYTDTVTVSFVDFYAKLKNPVFSSPDEAERAELAGWIGECARRAGIAAVACSESGDWSAYGIGRSSCIDRARIERICGCPLTLKADKNQRGGCGCAESIDIGVYDTCTNGCIYCYANRSEKRAAELRALHDPASEILVGDPAGAVIREKNLRSSRREQYELF